jgi:hypothetical protein
MQNKTLKKYLKSFGKKEIKCAKNLKTSYMLKEILNSDISEIEKFKIKKLLRAVIIERFFEKEMNEQKISIVEELNIYINDCKEISKIILSRLDNPDDLLRNKLMLIDLRLGLKEK